MYVMGPTIIFLKLFNKPVPSVSHHNPLTRFTCQNSLPALYSLTHTYTQGCCIFYLFMMGQFFVCCCVDLASCSVCSIRVVHIYEPCKPCKPLKTFVNLYNSGFLSTFVQKIFYGRI